MATLRAGLLLRLHCYLVVHLSFQKNVQVPMTSLQNRIIVVFELHGRVASQVDSAKKPVALRHMPVTLQFCFTHFETHVQMLAQSGSRHLSAAAPCLERIHPLSSNLFCFQLMRIDAYPRLCSLRVRLLSVARFNYSLPSLLSTSR